MADTHLNAFFMDVDEKLSLVRQAQAAYEASIVALEAKKKAVGYVGPEPEPESHPPKEEQDSTVTANVSSRRR